MENQQYLDTLLRPIFHQLTLDLLLSKPQHPNLIPFIKSWLNQHESKFNVQISAPAPVQAPSSSKANAGSGKKADKKNSFSDEEEDEEVDLLLRQRRFEIKNFWKFNFLIDLFIYILCFTRKMIIVHRKKYMLYKIYILALIILHLYFLFFLRN